MGLRSWLIHKLGGYTYEDAYGCNESTNDDYIDLTELAKKEARSYPRPASPVPVRPISSILYAQNQCVPPPQLVSVYHGQIMSNFNAYQAVQWQRMMTANDIRSACCRTASRIKQGLL